MPRGIPRDVTRAFAHAPHIILEGKLFLFAYVYRVFRGTFLVFFIISKGLTLVVVANESLVIFQPFV